MASDPINLINQFLIAMPGMVDEAFAGAVVYLCEHSEKGALGLMINKPVDIRLRNLFEKVDLTLASDDLGEQPVFYGGPVQTERGFVLHERIEGSAQYNSTLSVPGGLDGLGLPLGLQIIGRPLDEQSVLDAGLAIEERSGFTARAEKWW